MPTEPQDKDHSLWNQVLEVLAEKVGARSFDTWFRPVVFESCNEAALRLTVPNARFRDWLLENYGELIRQAVVEVFGAPRELDISAEAGDPVSDGPQPLPVVQAFALEVRSSSSPWLIENLWLVEAVGIIGGPPRAYKSLLALDMAVSVASGSPCLGAYPVHSCGPVLLYAAEDSLSSLRLRLESLARNRQIDFQNLDVRVITVDMLQLDRVTDQERFEATVALHQPKLLILDPLVRIHGADENASGAMAALLGYFRALQRKMSLAIVLVHHARKNLSAGRGYSLRGSSDFYAWTDSFLYLERRRDQRTLSVEHRSAPGLGPLIIELVTPSLSGNGPYLRLVSAGETAPENHEDSLRDRVLELLSSSREPVTADVIRSSLRARRQRVLEALRALSGEGKVLRLDDGYALQQFPVPHP